MKDIPIKICDIWQYTNDKLDKLKESELKYYVLLKNFENNILDYMTNYV